jgi:hypothetical protein
MNLDVAAIDRAIAEASMARARLDANPGHRAAQARGQIDASILALTNARNFLLAGASGVVSIP